MRAGLDNNILVWATRMDPRPVDGGGRDIADLQRRAQTLVADLNQKSFDIVIPAVVLSEYLCAINTAKHGNVIAVFKELFFTQPFDDHAAAVAASLYRSTRTLEVEPGQTKRVLKIDTMVVASAHVARCSTFYSNDKRCRKLAEMLGMIARDLPTHSEDLLINLEAGLPPSEGGLPPILPPDDLPPFALE